MVAYALAPRTPLPPSFLTQISQMRQPGVSFLLFFNTDLITQLDLSHETYFVTKGPDLYVQKEQQLLSLSPGTSSMFEDEKENRENENSLRSNGSGEFSLASVGDSRLRRQTTLHLRPPAEWPHSALGCQEPTVSYETQYPSFCWHPPPRLPLSTV